MMNVRRTGLVVISALSLALGACAGGSDATRASTGRAAAHEFVQGPHVATGTAVRVRLTQPLDLASSSEGGSFDAVLEDDLRTQQGTVLVRSGATIHGRVGWSARSGRVTLRGAHVESPVGPIDIHAALLGAGQPAANTNPSLRPTGPDPSRSTDSFARQPGAVGADPQRSRIDCDTSLTLQLTRPLLAPGARVLRD